VRHRSPQAATRQDASPAPGQTLLAPSLVLALVSFAGCASRPGFEAASVTTRGFHLVERGEYQVLYDSKGRILRLLHDANRDGVADAQVLFWPNGKPRTGEVDTDGDGRVDRREAFDPNGEPALPGRPGAPTR
jgi:hypothetical protein